MTRAELKTLVVHNRWDEVGAAFGFVPIYHFDTRNWIDWSKVPQAVRDILWPPNRKPTPGMDRFPATNAAGQNVVPPGWARISQAETIEQSLLKRKVWSHSTHFERRYLFDVQRGYCHYCERKTAWLDWTCDHKIPTSLGGSNKMSNKVGACRPCNSSKSNLTERQFFFVRPKFPGIKERVRFFKLNGRVL